MYNLIREGVTLFLGALSMIPGPTSVPRNEPLTGPGARATFGAQGLNLEAMWQIRKAIDSSPIRIRRRDLLSISRKGFELQHSLDRPQADASLSLPNIHLRILPPPQWPTQSKRSSTYRASSSKTASSSSTARRSVRPPSFAPAADRPARAHPLDR